MITPGKTRTVEVGSVKLGAGAPVVIQSMTKLATTDVHGCVDQIRKLVAAGCGLVRLAIPTKADSAAFGQIVEAVDIPLVADIHFSPARAIEAIEAGAAKIRLNPGNIKDRADLARIIDAAKMHRVAIRIGVNEASIRDLRSGDVPADKRVELMLAELRGYVRFFESKGFGELVLSAKSADTVRTIEVNREIARAFDYPIHIGLTHAGLIEDATVASAVVIGTLLAEGIGDTVRVSIAGDPLEEVKLARNILRALGMYPSAQPELIVCPTCGRCQIDVVKLARQVKKAIKDSHTPLRIAVMGCVVNGPGEAADADLAVCAASGKGYIYRHGKRIATVPEDKLLETLRQEIARA